MDGTARHALLVATSRYANAALTDLDSARSDVRALAEVLGDERIGDFTVRTVLDRPSHEVLATIEALTLACGPRDVMLFYFTGHGIKGADGRLYFAATNTEPELLGSSAVAATWVHDTLEGCRSRRQIVLLDCCHSGAFPRGVKAGGRAGSTQQLAGRGRGILTASDAIEFSLERESDDQVKRSVFTTAVVRGLRTGAADIDGDGRVTLHNLYDYVYEEVRRDNPQQTPELSADVQGALVVARNPFVTTPLPPELEAAAVSVLAGVRRGAVDELRALLTSTNDAQRQAAVAALQRLTADDSRTVAAAAAAALAAHNADQPEAAGVAESTGTADDSGSGGADSGGTAARRPEQGAAPSLLRPRGVGIRLAPVLALVVLLAAWAVVSFRSQAPGSSAPDGGAALNDEPNGESGSQPDAQPRSSSLAWRAATLDTQTTGELEAAVWDGSRWIAVGWRSGVGAVLLTSSDGETWKEPYASELQEHSDLQLFGVAAGRGTVVAVGSDRDRGDTDAAVWRLHGDDRQRVRSDDLAGEGYQEIRAVTWDSEQFVAVGCTDLEAPPGAEGRCADEATGTQRPAVWTSDDGNDWIRRQIPDARPAVMTAVVRTGAALTAAGYEQPGATPTRIAAFWRSDDSMSWQPAAAVDPRSQPVGSVLGLETVGAHAVAVGWWGATREADARDLVVWSSDAAGDAWRRVLHEEADDRQLLIGAVTIDGHVHAIGRAGTEVTSYQAVWRSSRDGKRWDEEDTGAFADGAQPTSAAISPDRAVIVGHTRGARGRQLAIWTALRQ